MNITFASHTPPATREALEGLLFFNSRQHMVYDGIIDALQNFGHPEIVVTPKGLSIRVPKSETQVLFAFDTCSTASNPVGVVVFVRSTPVDIVILHLAIHPDYALQGSAAGRGCGILLIEKVQEVAARIVGVQRVVFFYRKELSLKVRTTHPSR